VVAHGSRRGLDPLRRRRAPDRARVEGDDRGGRVPGIGDPHRSDLDDRAFRSGGLPVACARREHHARGEQQSRPDASGARAAWRPCRHRAGCSPAMGVSLGRRAVRHADRCLRANEAGSAVARPRLHRHGYPRRLCGRETQGRQAITRLGEAASQGNAETRSASHLFVTSVRIWWQLRDGSDVTTHHPDGMMLFHPASAYIRRREPEIDRDTTGRIGGWRARDRGNRNDVR